MDAAADKFIGFKDLRAEFGITFNQRYCSALSGRSAPMVSRCFLAGARSAPARSPGGAPKWWLGWPARRPSATNPNTLRASGVAAPAGPISDAAFRGESP
jgi:hypothetical protein